MKQNHKPTTKLQKLILNSELHTILNKTRKSIQLNRNIIITCL